MKVILFIFIIFAITTENNVVFGQSRITPYKMSRMKDTLYEEIWVPFKKSIGRSWKQLLVLPPETYMKTPQLIENAGFPAEEHEIKTEDGYFLKLHRIPPSKNNTERSSSPAIPVLIANVIFCCTSAQWVINLRNQSLGFVLADAGYDVWLGNYRGGGYSRKHEKYRDNTRQFWDFSYDEMAKYDVTSMIDYIVKTTGHEKIFLAGLGFGANPLFFALSDFPQYNDKVLGLVSMSGGPEMYDTKMKKGAKGSARVIQPAFDWFAHKYLIASWSRPYYFNRIAPYVFNIIAPVFMNLTGTLTTGKLPISNVHYNLSRIAIYAGHTPVGFNAHVFAHFIQLFGAEGAIHYNWGNKERNLKQHGHETPQKYDLTKVTVPTFVMYSKYDILFAREEADNINRDIKNVVMYEIDDPAWAHYSYLMFINTKKVFERMIQFFQDAAEQERLRNLKPYHRRL